MKQLPGFYRSKDTPGTLTRLCSGHVCPVRVGNAELETIGHTMSYDHKRKAGNAADVWKHFILLTVAEKLLAQHDRKTEFDYVESHCGQGIYPLLPGGAWLTGIHKLTSSSENLLQGRYKRYCQD